MSLLTNPIALSLFTVFLSQTTYSWEIKDVFSTLPDDQRIKVFAQSPTLPDSELFEAVDVRVTEEWDRKSRERSYGFRLSPKPWGARTVERRILSLYRQSQEAQKVQLSFDAIYERMELIRQHHFAQKQKELLESTLLVLKHAARTPLETFDRLDLESRELEVQSQLGEVQVILGSLKAQLEKYLGEGKVDKPSWSALPSVVRVREQWPNLSRLEVYETRLLESSVLIAREEVELARRKDNKLIEFLEMKYSKDLKNEETYSLQLGISLSALDPGSFSKASSLYKELSQSVRRERDKRKLEIEADALRGRIENQWSSLADWQKNLAPSHAREGRMRALRRAKGVSLRQAIGVQVRYHDSERRILDLMAQFYADLYLYLHSVGQLEWHLRDEGLL